VFDLLLDISKAYKQFTKSCQQGKPKTIVIIVINNINDYKKIGIRNTSSYINYKLLRGKPIRNLVSIPVITIRRNRR